jgi:hypothetical protein
MWQARWQEDYCHGQTLACRKRRVKIFLACGGHLVLPSLIAALLCWLDVKRSLASHVLGMTSNYYFFIFLALYGLVACVQLSSLGTVDVWRLSHFHLFNSMNGRQKGALNCDAHAKMYLHCNEQRVTMKTNNESFLDLFVRGLFSLQIKVVRDLALGQVQTGSERESPLFR